MYYELFFYYIMVYECENIEDNILIYFGKYLYYQLYFDLDICNILKWV